MRTLGTYKPEFDPIIEMYAELKERLENLQKTYEKDAKTNPKCFQVETVQGGWKKAPIIGIMEQLGKDILACSDRLLLNPKSLAAANIALPPEMSELDKRMAALMRDDDSDD